MQMEPVVAGPHDTEFVCFGIAGELLLQNHFDGRDGFDRLR